VKDGFAGKLKDCGASLAKNMLNPFGAKPEPKSFMTQCAVDGIKKEIPDGFPGKDKIVGSLNNFVNGLLNTAMAGGALDPKKLVSAIGGMDVNSLLDEVRKVASGDCVVDEPYTPSPFAGKPSVAAAEEKEEEESGVSFGIRAGMNFSHVYTEYSGRYGYSRYADWLCI